MTELPEVAVSRIGGDIAVDFFNTVDWRLDPARRSDRLPGFEHLLSWSAQTGLLGDEEARTLARLAAERPEEAGAEHAAVIELREQTYDALNDGADPVVLRDALVRAQAAGRLARDADGQWRWVQDALELATVRHRLAIELARMMTSPRSARFHRCEDRHCGWVFLDTSRLHNRRWCSSADCGNRNRARAHYARQAAGAAGTA